MKIKHVNIHIQVKPRPCGNKTIRYPFYIKGIQEPFWGYPGFGISSDNNTGFPILNLTNTFYIIDEIFYQNQSLRVSNAVFSRSNINKDCLSPSHNLTFPLDVTQQSYLERCKGTELDCFAENETSSVRIISKNPTAILEEQRTIFIYVNNPHQYDITKYKVLFTKF
jgi:hypothetical protein